MVNEKISRNAAHFNEGESILIDDQAKKEAEPALEAWKSRQRDPEIVTRIDDILRRGGTPDEGIRKDEAEFLEKVVEEGKSFLAEAASNGKPKQWWENQLWRTGASTRSREGGEPESEAREENTNNKETATAKKVDRSRWSSEEQSIIFRGFSALMKKDGRGRNLQDKMQTELRRENLVIDEMSFFRAHGPYSMMMPDTLNIMLDMVTKYGKLPEAADEGKQEHVERVLDLINRAKSGDLSPNQMKELEVDIQRIRDQVRKSVAKSAEESEEDDGLESDVEDTSSEVAEKSADDKKRPKKRREQINVRWKEKWDKVQQKNEWKKEWEKKRDATKEWSDFTERFLVLFTATAGWGGEGAIAKSPAEYDDIFHATDGIVRMDRELIDEEDKRKRVKQTYTLDSTDSAEEGLQKTANTLRFIDLALLTTLEFSQWYRDDGSVELEGMQSLIPRLNYVISRPIAAEIAILLKNDQYEMLASHPVQLMVLRQAQAQIAAFMAYIETEYTRDQRRKDNKMEIIDAFARLRDLIDAAAEEREEVLRREFEGLNQLRETRELTAHEHAVFTMLSKGRALWTHRKGNENGELYDREHGNYMRAFRPDRMDRTVRNADGPMTGAYSRLSALLEKYPAVRTEEEESGEKAKKPAPMLHKRGAYRGQMRTEETVRRRRKGKSKESTSDVINNPPASETEA